MAADGRYRRADQRRDRHRYTGGNALWFGTLAEAAPLQRIERAEAFRRRLRRDRRGEDSPCYRPVADRVQIAFHSPELAYGTLAHCTGHPARLNRTFGKRFGDDAYGAEELVAELSAAFTCALIGIDAATRTDHASYLAGF